MRDIFIFFLAFRVLQEANSTCFLQNASLEAVTIDKNDKLNISWKNPVKENVTLTINSNGTTINALNLTISGNNYITQSVDTEIHNDFLVIIKGEDICKMEYTAPYCIKNVCDGSLVEQPKILGVEKVEELKFRVNWKSVQYKNEEVKEIHYRHNVSGSFEVNHSPPLEAENYLKEHFSIITAKLVEGKPYLLMALFVFNDDCQPFICYSFFVPQKKNYVLIILLVTSSVLLLFLLIKCNKLVCKFYVKVMKILKEGSDEIVLTTLERENVRLSLNRNYAGADILLNPFDEYEFPWEKIELRERIGEGAFGQVHSAKAFGIDGCPDSEYKMVAVKTLGGNITPETINDFTAEIEIFKRIGVHPNIVKLLGCCTLGPPMAMIMELVPCGDLKSYLVELRKQWLKLRKNQFVFPDTSDGAYVLPESPPQSPRSVTSSRLPSTSETIVTTLDDQMTPLLSHYNAAIERVLDHVELQIFALQIAKGMAHLEKIPITHRDLAARNILINEYKLLKISDFGLSRNGIYTNFKTRRLPLRWMAIESITEHTYDSKTDVWSFGVVLWEIATLGLFPYEEIPDRALLQFLQNGERLERPEVCTEELYSMMMQCWDARPDNRPTFQELVDLLDVKNRKVYVDFSHRAVL